MDIYFFAAARAAAGISHTSISLDELDSPTLASLLSCLSTHFTGTTATGMSLSQVLERCSFLVDGEASATDTSLVTAQRVDVLPPFAGG